MSRVLEKETGTPFVYVGKVIDGTGMCFHRNDETVQYSDIRCKGDELTRMRRLYPREE